MCGCDVRDSVTFPSSDLACSTKSSSTNIPDRHVVNPVTSSKLSTVNYNTSTPFSSTALVKILGSTPLSWLSWRLSEVVLLRMPIRKSGVWTFATIRKKVLFILWILNVCSAWWGGFGTGIGGRLSTGVVPWRELCTLTMGLNNLRDSWHRCDPESTGPLCLFPKPRSVLAQGTQFIIIPVSTRALCTVYVYPPQNDRAER
jgi:hypothetical protein